MKNYGDMFAHYGIRCVLFPNLLLNTLRLCLNQAGRIS